MTTDELVKALDEFPRGKKVVVTSEAGLDGGEVADIESISYSGMMDVITLEVVGRDSDEDE